MCRNFCRPISTSFLAQVAWEERPAHANWRHLRWPWRDWAWYQLRAQRDHAGWDRKVGNILWCVQGITMENHEFGMNLDVSLFFTIFHQPKCLTWLNNQTYSKFNNMASDTQKCKVSTLDQILILNKTNTHMTSTNHLTCSWRILATGQVSGVFLWLDLSGWRDHAASANKTVVARKSLTNIGYRATLWSCSHLSSIYCYSMEKQLLKLQMKSVA